MASATGIPEHVHGHGEEEPLLGRAGDASQQDGKPFLYNLWIGMFLTEAQVSTLLMHILILMDSSFQELHPLHRLVFGL